MKNIPYFSTLNTIQSMAQQTLKQLKEDIYLKACCLEACKDGFSVKEYQRTKAIKAIEVEKSGKKKMEIKDDVMDGNPLYAALSAWRLQKAQDADVPAFTIAHNKILNFCLKKAPFLFAFYVFPKFAVAFYDSKLILYVQNRKTALILSFCLKKHYFCHKKAQDHEESFAYYTCAQFYIQHSRGPACHDDQRPRRQLDTSRQLLP